MNKTFIFSLIRPICCYSASLKDQARLGLRKNKAKKSYQNHDCIDGFESDPYYVNLDICWERNNVAWKNAPWERRYPVAKTNNIRFAIY